MDTQLATTIIADISESTPLYQAMGDDQAQRLIQLEIDRLREVMLDHGGTPVGQKGDDVLSYFDDHDAAIHAALKMIEQPPGTMLSVHVGVHRGAIVVAEKGIFGEAVNLTARLAAVANPGEACVSEAVAAMVKPGLRQLLKPIGALRLKGISDPLEVFSLVRSASDLSTQTRLPLQFGGGDEQGYPSEALTLVLNHGGRSWRCREGGELKIGRSSQCDVVLPQAWVSRLHAVLSLKDGKLMLADRSTSGTYVQFDAGREIQLKREAVMLADGGLISPALPIQHDDAQLLEFEILRR
ncbi:MAG: FHA domain-containing protein [Ruegeria sp.]|uniref:FHA domain-containing protein n=1 Tax=Ruegeria sp. TaxID=1879320 RepID=UPI00349E7466